MRTRVAVLASLLALQACGGGGDGAEAAKPVAGDITCGLANFQADALRIINAKRAQGATCGTRGSFAPAASLAWNTALANAAYGHSLDMAQHNFFAHDGSDGSTFDQRITAAGYGWSSVAENIAGGPTSVQAVVDGWMASDGHCANLMSASYRDMGLACARNSASTYGWYWTLDLASP